MEVTGGRAHLHGVSFANDRISVKAYRTVDNTIRTETGQKYWRGVSSIDFLYSLPFLRGIMVYFDVLMSMWKVLLIAWLGILAVLEGLSFVMPAEQFDQTVNGVTVLLHIAKVLAVIYVASLFKRSRMASYHGAEHKVFHNHLRNKAMTVKNVRSESRLSAYCGTNLVVFVSFVYGLLWLLNVDPLLRLILSAALGYELFILPRGEKGDVLYYLLTPFYFIGLGLQKIVFTSEPEDEEIEVAIASFEKLKACQPAGEEQRQKAVHVKGAGEKM